jgi:acyl carrier protein
MRDNNISGSVFDDYFKKISKTQNNNTPYLLESNGKTTSCVYLDETDLVNDLGFDSLELAELTVVIEEEYGIDIFEHKIIRTVGEIRTILNA